MVKLCDVLGLKAVKTEEILDKEIEDLIERATTPVIRKRLLEKLLP